MNKNLRHNYFNVPIVEWIKRAPVELDIDNIGFWQIYNNGKEGFGLKDEDLWEFLYESILEILSQGGRPYIDFDYENSINLFDSYSKNREKLADLVLKKSREIGHPDEFRGIWFERR